MPRWENILASETGLAYKTNELSLNHRVAYQWKWQPHESRTSSGTVASWPSSPSISRTSSFSQALQRDILFTLGTSRMLRISNGFRTNSADLRTQLIIVALQSLGQRVARRGLLAHEKVKSTLSDVLVGYFGTEILSWRSG